MKYLLLWALLVAGTGLAVLLACRAPGAAGPNGAPSTPPGPPGDDGFAALRRRMVDEQIRARGIRDERVLAAMLAVPRQRFVPEPYIAAAYEDGPLPIGSGQTISQPYIVAFMTEAIRPRPEHKVLEVGTGSGYQAAVLAALVAQVYTIELLPELGQKAAALVAALPCPNVRCRIGDGYGGWPEAAPFDAIVVTAAAPTVPPRLVEQLAPGGVMVIPVGGTHDIQYLLRITREPDGRTRTENLMPVRFVPLVPGKR